MWNSSRHGTDAGSHKRGKELLAHEYIESKLIERGMPFNSGHRDYWMNDLFDEATGPSSRATPEHYGAHDLSPGRGIFRWSMYDRMGLPRPDVDIADDLSNLDEVPDAIWEIVQSHHG